MFVKNYLTLVTAMKHASNIHDVHDLFLETGDYLKNNSELVKAENDFEQMIKKQVGDAVFSYYPELKPKEISLRKELEIVIDECAGDIFSITFDIVYQYLENPDHQEDYTKWNWHILTDEQILDEATEETKHLSGEDRALSIQDRIKTRKIMNHIYYFNVVIHKAILSCLAAVFLEIPLLSGNGIRYLNYLMSYEARKLRDKMITLFHKDLKEPEVE